MRVQRGAGELAAFKTPKTNSRSHQTKHPCKIPYRMLAFTTSIRRNGAPLLMRTLSTGSGRRLPLGEDEDPFEVIGVGVEADERKIKESFYAKAKVLHPDVAGAGGDTKAAFARLVRSYEDLMDPNLRAEYLLRKRRRSSSSNGSASGGGFAGGIGSWGRATPTPVEEFNESLRRGRREKAYRGRGYAEAAEEEAAEAAGWHRGRRRPRAAADAGWSMERELAMLGGGLLGQLQQEFDDAMLFAYLGPRVEEGETAQHVLLQGDGFWSYLRPISAFVPSLHPTTRHHPLGL